MHRVTKVLPADLTLCMRVSRGNQGIARSAGAVRSYPETPRVTVHQRLELPPELRRGALDSLPCAPPRLRLGAVLAERVGVQDGVLDQLHRAEIPGSCSAGGL